MLQHSRSLSRRGLQYFNTGIYTSATVISRAEIAGEKTWYPPRTHQSFKRAYTASKITRMASSNTISSVKGDGYTLGVLACGTMGNAILSGIFQSLNEQNKLHQSSSDRQLIPSRFVASVRRPEGAQKIKSELRHYPQFEKLSIYQNDNTSAAKEADVVILACAPNKPASILQAPGMKEALSGKLLIHILAGVSVKDVQEQLHDTTAPETSQCTIVRTLPNAAAAVRQSCTVVATSDPLLTPEHDAIVKWIFSQVGRVIYLPEAQMNIAAVLAGATPAMMATLIDGIAQGGIELGSPMRESYEMAAQAMIAAGTLVLQGAHPAQVRDGCSCPGGCTAKSLAVIEEGAVKGTLAKAVREGVGVAEKLGAKSD
ncbi:Pyrroline-5-carboxylate reductase [Cercospora beticola]|uniref:Pyrroline-5-carboxylate reductase n=1 Tax=Cercospora beticola TaxID=122368 RepID=A0A2G5HQR1_CERBT|nr:Pyrroline-5-carboxylate reductase [Cercospora beticola]PIA94858.1 Pyrroline-5-carboxylate reductase [Cercospora beticola]WPB04810.1 hypothetical protein RHO25_009457 [Cercospora beticola]